jgi:hypothetical protein
MFSDVWKLNSNRYQFRCLDHEPVRRNLKVRKVTRRTGSQVTSFLRSRSSRGRAVETAADRNIVSVIRNRSHPARAARTSGAKKSPGRVAQTSSTLPL